MDTLVQLRSSSGKPEQLVTLLPRLTCECGGLTHGDTEVGTHTCAHTHMSPLSSLLLQRLKVS